MSFLRPNGIAVVGASEGSVWTRSLLHNLDTVGGGPVHLVNPKGGQQFGRPVARSLTELSGRSDVDTAFVVLNAHRVLPALREATEIGVRNAVVLASGFAEAGTDGQQRQAELAALAAETGLRVLGPNSLGLLNLCDGVGMLASGLELPAAGAVAVVSQSGGLSRAVLRLANAHGVGISHVVTTGNESVVDCADVIDALLDDGRSRSIAVFAESVRRPRAFLDAATRALAAGVPVVLLKVGRTDAGQRVSAAHTGGLANDHAILAGLLRQHGVVEVDSLEDLVIVAGLLARTGRLPGPRVAVLSPSGGRCTLIADEAHAAGLDLPALRPATRARIDEVLQTEVAVSNPLDVTGAFVTDPTVFRRLLDALADDGGLDLVVVALDLPDPGTPAARVLERLFADLREVSSSGPLPVLLLETTYAELTPGRELLQRELGIEWSLPGVHHGLHALARALWWSQAAVPPAPEASPVVPLPDTMSEHVAREVLGRFGVPLVPAVLASTADDAVAAAFRVGFPVAVKMSSPGLAHKSDVGGVVLDVRDPAAVAAAFARVAGVDGVLVSPMRTGGVELIVGVLDHPQWGPLLAVGLGGVLAEALRDTAWRGLPVSDDEIGRMLGELRGGALLDGVRGIPPADRERLVAAIAAMARAGGGLRGQYQALEVNPLYVRGDVVEALDALIVRDAA
ncbi:acetate--CoA ligase family protein [Dactylosporangium sp. AC04546]|uniref:acetate--CoA ligase family protein n=1 Tax=Dactylosporangium sp. AC04546 TaxID=2862460 RepID=UPI001EE0D67D|nr:acetate--CoA ligase family protein [Dactylosporangium sp. AC04546]WVK88229.1 acetate--CoA ligase family protein [Dactylosporangium sp. AC04546]